MQYYSVNVCFAFRHMITQNHTMDVPKETVSNLLDQFLINLKSFSNGTRTCRVFISFSSVRV